MITFAEAQEIVRTRLESSWTPGCGTLYVAPHGFEDKDFWLVRAGAREALVDDDPRFGVYDGSCELVVEKKTGRFGPLDVRANRDRLSRMRRVPS